MLGKKVPNLLSPIFLGGLMENERKIETAVAEKLYSFYNYGSLSMFLRLVKKINEDGAIYVIWLMLSNGGRMTREELKGMKGHWMINKLMVLSQEYGLVNVSNGSFILSRDINSVIRKLKVSGAL